MKEHEANEGLAREAVQGLKEELAAAPRRLPNDPVRDAKRLLCAGCEHFDAVRGQAVLLDTKLTHLLDHLPGKDPLVRRELDLGHRLPAEQVARDHNVLPHHGRVQIQDQVGRVHVLSHNELVGIVRACVQEAHLRLRSMLIDVPRPVHDERRVTSGVLRLTFSHQLPHLRLEEIEIYLLDAVHPKVFKVHVLELISHASGQGRWLLWEGF